MKTALIMEGGAMRGMFTCGVMDVLLEHGVAFDGAGGISAGAVFGCNYKSRQAGRPIRYNKRFCRDPRYCSFRSLLSTGEAPAGVDVNLYRFLVTLFNHCYWIIGGILGTALFDD